MRLLVVLEGLLASLPTAVAGFVPTLVRRVVPPAVLCQLYPPPMCPPNIKPPHHRQTAFHFDGDSDGGDGLQIWQKAWDDSKVTAEAIIHRQRNNVAVRRHYDRVAAVYAGLFPS